MHGGNIPMNEAGPVQFPENGHDAAGAVDILDVIILCAGSHLAEMWDLSRQPVDVGHGEGDPALVGGRQQVENRIRRSSHGDIERHRILEGL